MNKNNNTSKRIDDLLVQYIMPAHMHNGIDKRAEAKRLIMELIEESYLAGHSHKGCEDRVDSDEPSCYDTCTPSLKCLEQLQKGES